MTESQVCYASRAFRVSVCKRSWSLRRGARSFFVGAGKGTRSPFESKMGRISSGTLECIKGLFRNLST